MAPPEWLFQTLPLMLLTDGSPSFSCKLCTAMGSASKAGMGKKDTKLGEAAGRTGGGARDLACLTHCLQPAAPASPELDGNARPGTSLVVQSLRTHLPVQGTQVQFLVRGDPACLGATT